MNIDLTPQLEELVRQKVNSGLYSSASEVVCEALQLMHEQDQREVAKLDQLRNDVLDGMRSGPAATWDPAEVKTAGHAVRRTNARGA